MRSHALYLPALIVAALGAAVVGISAFYEPARTALVRPMTLVAACVAVILFLRMLFDPQCHRGIEAANSEMQGDQPLRFRRIGFFDPQWGLLGSRGGERPLQVVRAVLFIEFIIALVLTSRNEPSILLLAAASSGVAMLLTLIHVGLNTQTQHP